ncbi:MAG: DNA alkylation repair protein [Phycisphaerales bacterium]|nr:MAG: DNA alkylation repair protein [Phycisphaerales bacterium]
MSTQTQQIMKKLRELSDSHIAAHSRRFFRTGPGQYGEGDRFLGIRVPVIRKCVREYPAISLPDTVELLKSPFHEARLLALLILVAKYSRAMENAEREAIYRSYLKHTEFINNWDLVDCSAEHIVGAHLLDKDKRPIYKLARSKGLWKRRIAVMSTFHFVKREDFSDTLAIAELLLNDPEDLIHQSVGWMLREVGSRNRKVEEKFLTKYYKQMPRTMLRYAIEKLPETDRQAYLQDRR